MGLDAAASALPSVEQVEEESLGSDRGVRVLTTKIRHPDGSESERREIWKDGVRMPDDFDLSAYTITTPTELDLIS